MKFNNFAYLFKEGIRGIFKHGFMSFAAVCVTVACLLVVGVFSSLMYNLNIMVENLNKTNEVVAYVDEDLSISEARSISTKFVPIDNILDATFKTSEEALEEFIADHPDDDAFDGVDASYLRHRYEIVLKDNNRIKDTVQQLESIDGVAKVSAAFELAEGFSTMQQVVHIVSIAVIVILLVVSLLIISNTVKLAMYAKCGTVRTARTSCWIPSKSGSLCKEARPWHRLRFWNVSALAAACANPIAPSAPSIW